MGCGFLEGFFAQPNLAFSPHNEICTYTFLIAISSKLQREIYSFMTLCILKSVKTNIMQSA